MAILQMQRISICALKKNRKAILEHLQDLGVMEVDIRLTEDVPYRKRDTTNAKVVYTRNTQAAERALDILQAYVPEKTGLLDSLAGKELVEKEMFENAAKNKYIDKAFQIIKLDKNISENKAAILKLQTQMETLVPWMTLPVPVNYAGTDKTVVMIGTIAGNPTMEELYALIASSAPEADAVDLEIISADSDYTYLAAVCLKKDAQQVEDALRAGGFARPSQQINKVPASFREELQAEAESLQAETDKLLEELKGFSGCRQELKVIADFYRVRAGKYEVLGKLPQTRNVFAISGYIPARDAQKVAQELTEKYEAVVEIEDLEEDDEAPVLMKNNKFAQCVDGVVASFGLPKKGELDPTFFTSIFYVFLFGLMLADAAYGFLISLVLGIVLVKFPRMETNLRKSIQLFFWCGLSTLFWGVMFGGYFGDAITVVARLFFNKEIVIPALWFVPLDDPMRLLLWSMGFGLIHTFTGLGLKGYMYLRDKDYMSFFVNCVCWYCFLIGLLGMLIPSKIFAGLAGAQIVFPAFVNTLMKGLAIFGAVMLLLFSARDNKNFGLRIALGAYDLYGITSWLSDILSYSRLLALGLASGVLANVFNSMGSMAGGGVVGAILFIIVFIVGHVFNLAINLLGAYVHTCRLQYVEFFGKFYEGGGRAFNPFTFKTKYVDIKEEN